ncbi:hypothetical protein [Spongiactinospora rosea]|nr:hypothetical protein [Spongiactinospora rosea]
MPTDYAALVSAGRQVRLLVGRGPMAAASTPAMAGPTRSPCRTPH